MTLTEVEAKIIRCVDKCKFLSHLKMIEGMIDRFKYYYQHLPDYDTTLTRIHFALQNKRIEISHYEATHFLMSNFDD